MSPKAEIDGTYQSHLENLRWAIEAEGQRLRTGKDPETCPNDMAWFLYVQARDNPKEFLAKLNALEAKQGENIQETMRLATKRTVEEIDRMLEELKGEESEH